MKTRLFGNKNTMKRQTAYIRKVFLILIAFFICTSLSVGFTACSEKRKNVSYTKEINFKGLPTIPEEQNRQYLSRIKFMYSEEEDCGMKDNTFYSEEGDNWMKDYTFYLGYYNNEKRSPISADVAIIDGNAITPDNYKRWVNVYWSALPNGKYHNASSIAHIDKKLGSNYRWFSRKSINDVEEAVNNAVADMAKQLEWKKKQVAEQFRIYTLEDPEDVRAIVTLLPNGITPQDVVENPNLAYIPIIAGKGKGWTAIEDTQFQSNLNLPVVHYNNPYNLYVENEQWLSESAQRALIEDYYSNSIFN